MKGGRERRGLIDTADVTIEKAVKGKKGKKVTPSVVIEPEADTEVFDRAGMVEDADADKE